MDAREIKTMLNAAISTVTTNIDEFVVRPGKDLCRNSKFCSEKLISFLITEGSSSTKLELLDFFNFQDNLVSDSALIQQRNKLKPEALQNILYAFNEEACVKSDKKYRFIAADGSTATYFSNSKYSPEEYHVTQGHSKYGFYSIHINAFQDLESHMYTDILLQPVHQKDEFGAFATIVDRHSVLPNVKNVYIGDRGYCSYNNMAHVIKAKQYFLFRAKDVSSKGIAMSFGIAKDECCDVWRTVKLTRSHDKKVFSSPDCRFICDNISFDYIKKGSLDTFDLTFRLLRFKITDSAYECIITNLPSDEFSQNDIKSLYNERWGIESSFRKLKYTIGLSNFHSMKPNFIKQEIFARIIMYNITEFAIYNACPKKTGRKRIYSYKVNFTVAAHICRVFFRCSTEEDSIDVMKQISQALIPIRDNRQYPRLQTAHFRRPRYFIYRAA